ncbi:MAG TPA: ATP-binding protein, partial [Streptosporangiaceae bacterium]|nr:ATP-binding protein [Streptosporangiaceae bacterium]
MATLPERLALARARDLSHAEFLELVLSDEVTRRDGTSAERRARQAGQLFKRLKAARLDNSHHTEIRKLLHVDLLIPDDFCLQPMDAADTADTYEVIVERHRTAATITTSNREPAEWLALMADP